MLGSSSALGQRWAARAVIAAAVLAVYLPGLDHSFQYDDLHSIVENPHLRKLANIDDFFSRPEMFTVEPKSAMYRPLLLVTYALNHAWGGYLVEGFRGFNLAIHLVNSLLLSGMACRFTGRVATGLACGLLFALHPIAGEPVNYISSRSESLCALFVLSGLALYTRMGVRGGAARYTGSVLAFAGALLAKSVGMVLPLVLFLYEASFGTSIQRRIVRVVKYLIPFCLVGVAYLLGMRQFLQAALVDHPVRGLGVQILTQAKAIVYYLKLLLVPVGQNVEHQFNPASGLGDPAVWTALALLGSFAWCLIGVWRRSGKVFFWLVWPSLFLLPTFVVPLNVLVNEHRLYIPTMGLAVSLAWLMTHSIPRPRALPIMALLVMSYGGLSLQRSQVWRTPETLWADALEKAPQMPRPHLYMGDVYREQGRNEDALVSYRRALSVNPQLLSGGDLLALYNNSGATYLAMGQNEEAAEWYRRALKIDPDYAKAKDALEALAALGESVWDPDSESRYQQGMTSLISGDIERALVALNDALVVQKHPKIYQALGVVHERRGEMRAALEAYQALLRFPQVPAGLQQSTRERIAVLQAQRTDFD